jgi:hypothetical protein
MWNVTTYSSASQSNAGSAWKAKVRSPCDRDASGRIGRSEVVPLKQDLEVLIR